MTLEMRYRRLLAVYPAEYRREYGTEMIGVLMSAAGPGQHRPSLPDVVDLLRGGLVARLRGGFRPARGAGWRNAAAVAGLFGAILLAAGPLYRLGTALRASFIYPEATFAAAHLIEVGARAGLWLAVVVAAVAGLRRTTALLAVVAALGEVGWLVVMTPADDFRVVRMQWVVLLGALVAAMLVTARRGSPVTRAWRTPDGVRGRILVLLATVGAVPAAGAWSNRALGLQWEMHVTPGLVAGAALITTGLPLVAAGLVGAALWARENRRLRPRG